MESPESSPEPREPVEASSEFGKSRIEALTDGIFAIAMTILVLEIQLPKLPPHPSETVVWQALAGLYPDFLAYVASFMTLAVYWVTHHTAFRSVMRPDRVVMWLNMVFLMFVALVPFTTNFYAGDADSRIANAVFGANLIFLGLLAYLIWAYSCDRNLTGSTNLTIRRAISRMILTGPVVALIALAVSLLQPVWAELIYFSMIPFLMISIRSAALPWLPHHPSPPHQNKKS